MKSKEIFWVVLLCLLPLYINAATISVNSGGTDQAGCGTSPKCATLSYALGIASDDDTIDVETSITDSGTFSANYDGTDLTGITIQGQGLATVVTTTRASGNYIYLEESSIGNSGPVQPVNWTVQNITFNGNARAAGGNTGAVFHLRYRDGITFQNMKFQNVLGYAIRVWGWDYDSTAWLPRPGSETICANEPPDYAENVVIDTVVFDNVGCVNAGTSLAAVELAATNGAEIKDCTFSLNYAGTGDGIYGEALQKGLLIYGNIIDTLDTDEDSFAIETRRLVGDSKIYDNVFNHVISLVGLAHSSLVGETTTHVQVYGNTFNQAITSQHSIEASNNFLEVYENYFTLDGAPRGGHVQVYVMDQNGCGETEIKNVTIHNNVWYNTAGRAIIIEDFDSGDDATDIYVYNNVFDSINYHGSTYNDIISIEWSGSGTADKIRVRNNIVIGDNSQSGGSQCDDGDYDQKPISITGAGVANVTNFYATHNYLDNFANDTNNAVCDAGATSPTINNNTAGTAPQWNGAGDKPSPYYEASSGTSNIVDAGVDVGLAYSGLAPDVGRYEFEESGGSSIGTGSNSIGTGSNSIGIP